MNTASDYLIALAQRNAAAYLAHTHPQAILLTGSAAEGASDFYSDLDLIIYYEVLPSDDQLQAARAQNGATTFRVFGPRTDREFGEQYPVDGVECQVAHITIAAWEADMASVLQDYTTDTPLQKALSGLLDGLPLHGAPLIQRWQAQAAAYPDGLARAMVAHYLQFFPIWYLLDRLEARDARLWVHQLLVESSYNILGILAGLNRLYYSPFQFKRLHKFVGKMPIAPTDLAARLDALLTADQETAVRDLERLVQETLALVRAHLPEVDTAIVPRQAGERLQPWTPRPGGP